MVEETGDLNDGDNLILKRRPTVNRLAVNDDPTTVSHVNDDEDVPMDDDESVPKNRVPKIEEMAVADPMMSQDVTR